MPKIWTAALVTSLAMAAAACNTVEGASEDVESVASEVDKQI